MTQVLAGLLQDAADAALKAAAQPVHLVYTHQAACGTSQQRCPAVLPGSVQEAADAALYHLHIWRARTRLPCSAFTAGLPHHLLPGALQEAADAALQTLRNLHTSRVTMRELERSKRSVLTRHESDLKVGLPVDLSSAPLDSLSAACCAAAPLHCLSLARRRSQ